MKNRIVKVDVEIKHETNAAVLVTDGGNEDAWIPKSQIQNDLIYSKGEVRTLKIPEWLAKEKGLI